MKYFLLFIISVNILVSKNINIYPHRLTAEYNGIVIKNNDVLVYGNYGLITMSKDLGNKWFSFNIGNEHHIKKIRKYQNLFIGISENSYFTSENGIDWNFFYMADSIKIKNFVVHKNKVYFLMNDGIYLSDFNFNLSKIYKLDKKYYYNEMESDSTYIYLIRNETQLLKYYPEDNQLQVTGLNSNTMQQGNYFHSLICYNKVCYIVSDDKKYHAITYIYSSTDKFKTWERINDIYTVLTSTYIPFGDDILLLDYYSRYITKDFNLTKDFVLNQPILKLFDTENKTYTTITDTSAKEYFQVYIIDNNLPFTQIKFQDSVIIAIGKNNIIIQSDDFGKTWNIVNIFKNQYILNIANRNKKPIITKNKNMLFKYNSKSIFYSKNNGMTFQIPVIHYSFIEHSLFRSMNTYFYENEKGFYASGDKVYKTNDFYETIDAIDLSYDFNNLKHNPEYEGIKFNDHIIFNLNNDIYNSPYSTIYYFNNNYQIVDSTIVDSIALKEMFIFDNKLFALGMKTTINDSIPSDDTTKLSREIQYMMMKSTDMGKQWENIEVDIPLEPHIFYNSKLNKYFEVDSYEAQYLVKDCILMPNTSDSSKLVYYFDLNNEKFESFELPAELNRTNIYDNMFEHKNKLYFVSSGSVFYYTENFKVKNIIWDSVDIKKYFPDWISKDDKGGTYDAVYSVWADDDEIYFTITNRPKNISGPFMSTVFLNLCKFYKSDSIVSVNQAETRPYFYNTRPYPIPAKSEVNTTIYWDNNYQIEKSDINVYDISGTKVNLDSEINFEQINSYKGNITWNCTSHPSGVYLISIQYGNTKETIKVMVSK